MMRGIIGGRSERGDIRGRGERDKYRKKRLPCRGTNQWDEEMNAQQKIASKRNQMRMNNTDQCIKPKYVQIGDRVVKVNFSSDKKRRKEFEKKKKMNILIYQKKKKRKEFEKKKKIVNDLNKIIQAERDKGNLYFLPKKFKRKKKSKQKRFILLEKKIRHGIYNDILKEIQNGNMEMEKRTLVDKTKSLENYEKDTCIEFITCKKKWMVKSKTSAYYLNKRVNLRIEWGIEHGKTKRHTADKHHFEGMPIRVTNDESFTLEVASLKKIIFMRSGKSPMGQGLIGGKKRQQKKLLNSQHTSELTKQNAEKSKELLKTLVPQNDGMGRARSRTRYCSVNGLNLEMKVEVDKEKTSTVDVKKDNHIINIADEEKNSAMLNKRVLDNHTGYAPSAKQIKECILKNEKIINYIHVSRVQKKIYINEYVDHKITAELNELVKEFLHKISKSHEKLYLMKKKKRYILGLKESYKHICNNEPKLVILAPNIEPMTNNAFDDQVNKIICKCKEKNVPLVFALSKNLLGKCINKSRQSIISVVDNDSYIKECNAIVNLAKSLKLLQ
ncbi:hypothetical protein, conserved [Plasmodium gonderi]|uniref:Ribosomal protein eL8/eL30/eS12/Gadd45 domain-containing protein n=1 Tax=Plasmodium gonderi TaxID=77519 RepID=A0A1Y1JL16_PLAGO|nr:hypothetical protein, conserved [Plasmodium gonderi]GAW80724.1 hypothetical protein, conserved [Plasmodium gonderi]